MRNVFDATELMDQARAIAGVKTTRERRIDEAVRAWSVDIHLPGCAKVPDERLSEWLMMYGHDFRICAEYRRIVEREEGRA